MIPVILSCTGIFSVKSFLQDIYKAHAITRGKEKSQNTAHKPYRTFKISGNLPKRVSLKCILSEYESVTELFVDTDGQNPPGVENI